MALSAAAVLAIAASCHIPGVPLPRILAAAQVESGMDALAIHDNSGGRSYRPASVAEAAATARALLAAGHRIDAGVMQVTSANWPALGLTVETAFDPVVNICAGAHVLAQDYAIERRVSCRYNTGRPVCGNGYPDRIARALAAPVSSSSAIPAASTPPRRVAAPIEDRPADVGVETVLFQGEAQ